MFYTPSEHIEMFGDYAEVKVRCLGDYRFTVFSVNFDVLSINIMVTV